MSEGVNFALTFRTGRCNTDKINKLLSNLGDMIEDADSEGYPHSSLAMCANLLEEILNGNGKAAFAAISNAAVAYSFIKTKELRSVNEEVLDELEDKVFDFVDKLLDNSLLSTEKDIIDRDLFADKILES